MWTRKGKENGHSKVEANGALKLFNVTQNDSGSYDCFIDEVAKARIHVQVRSMLNLIFFLILKMIN